MYPVQTPGFRLHESADGHEIRDSSDRRVARLNSTGTLVFAHCHGGLEVDEIGARLCELLSSADPGQVARDVHAVVRTLESNGFVTLEPHRSLPDFVVAGAQKGGTETLKHNLGRHPDVHMASQEIHFFSNDRNFERGPAWYRRFFRSRRPVKGEKTPNYLARNVAHSRMHWLIPNARLIVVLRNPVTRAYSQWNHFNQIRAQSAQWGWTPCDFESSLDANPSVLGFGQYARQLEHLFEYFPRKSVHIGISERFRHDGDAEFAHVCRFLDLKPAPFEYESTHSRPYAAPMPAHLRRRLVDYYREPNERLFALLGTRIEEWTT